MSSLYLLPDTPCTYPTTTVIPKKVGVSSTPTVVAVFRNISEVANLRAILQRFDFIPTNPSADTIVSIQMAQVSNVTGGTWADIVGSELDINLSTTSLTVDKVALTLFSQATAGQGNTPATGTLAESITGSLGLELHKGYYFAIIASTDKAASTVDLLWSVNWLERD